MQAPLAMIYVLRSSTMYAGDCWSTASSSTGRGMLCTATTSNCHQYRKLRLAIHKRSIIVADTWHARSWMLQQLTCAGRLPQPNPRLPQVLVSNSDAQKPNGSVVFAIFQFFALALFSMPSRSLGGAGPRGSGGLSTA